jgi:hypothetical protein
MTDAELVLIRTLTPSRPTAAADPARPSAERAAYEWLIAADRCPRLAWEYTNYWMGPNKPVPAYSWWWGTRHYFTLCRRRPRPVAGVAPVPALVRADPVGL